MVEIKSRLQSVTAKERWVARIASLMAKLKATKVVWFPPEPTEAGKKTAATAKKTTKGAKKTTTTAAKKTPSGSKS